MDAIQKLTLEGLERCQFASTIIGPGARSSNSSLEVRRSDLEASTELNDLNESQRVAVSACSAPLSLIWGPPGESKTCLSGRKT
jgi:hypothetical protein